MNTAEEDALVLSMAEEAIASGNNTLGQQLDYWTGGVKTDGVWGWRSGAPMVYTNWHSDNPDGLKGGPCTTLLKNLYDGYSSYQWAAEPDHTTPDQADNGVICEMKLV